jgi:hypothetical protein
MASSIKLGSGYYERYSNRVYTTDADNTPPPTIEDLAQRVAMLEQALSILLQGDGTEDAPDELPLHQQPGMSSTPKPRTATGDSRHSLRTRNDALTSNTNSMIGRINEANRRRYN